MKIRILLMIVLIVAVGVSLSGCANRQEWQRTIIEDRLKNITTTTLIYKGDTGFDPGTKGLGDYSIIKLDAKD